MTSSLLQSFDPEEQHPAVMGILSMGALLLPLGVLLQLGVWVNRWWWAHASAKGWEMPFLIGLLTFGVYYIYLSRLTGSRAAWWYAYFEAWTETLNYPTEAADE